MRQLLLIFTLLVGFSFWTYGQTLSSSQAEAKRLSDSCITLARQYGKAGQREKGMEYVHKAIKICTDAKLLTDLGFAYWELSGFYDLSKEQSATKLATIQQAVDAFHQAGNVKKEADALKELADARQVHGNYDQSIRELKQALKLYQSIGEPDLEGVYDLLGNVSCSVGNLNDALQYGILAVQAAEKRSDTTLQLCTVYNHLGMTYFYLKDLPNSAACYAKALAVAENHKAKAEIYILSYNYGNNLKRMGLFAECNRHLDRIMKTYPGIDTNNLILYINSYVTNYTFLRDFETAGKYLEQQNRLTKGRQFNVEIQRALYIASTRYLLESGHYKEARAVLTKADEFMAKNSMLIHLASNQQYWARLDSATGDFRSAYDHLTKYAQLRDSVLNQEKTNAIAKLNVQYETNRKDQDLLLKEKDIQLLKQESQLQQGELTRSNQTRNGAIAAGLLLLVIVVLLVKISSVRQRANRKLKDQQKEIEKKNVTLEHLVEEKEWLVKEIHHRVKNNFHMVIALLGTQSEYLRTQEAIDAITDSQNRVQAMSLVHQKLYQSENLSDINMAEYIHDLVYHLRTCLNIGTGVQFTFDLDPIRLDLTYCIPLGLIINEAMTNSVKYAFPKNSPGQIGVSFKRVEQDYLELRITDNGVGLPASYDTRNTGSMGFKLIKGLSDDIDGRLEIRGDHGTQIIVLFQYDFPAAAKNGARNTQLTTAI